MRIGHEYFSEIIDNLKCNRLRTFLTDFAVAWGIIFLVILLSIGVELSRGIPKSVNAGDTEPNYGIYFEVWMTNLPYQGYPAGRWLYFDESQLAQLQEMVPTIKDTASRLRSWNKISYTSQVVGGMVKDVGANYFRHSETRVKILAGQDINGSDIYDRERTLLISSSDTLRLFGTDRYSEAIGESVSVDNVSFIVVGIYETSQNQSTSYILSSTFTMIHPSDQRIGGSHIYAPTIQNRKDFEAFNEELLKAPSSILSLSSDDDQAIWDYSNCINNEQYNKVVSYFYLFLRIVGLSTLLTGIVGVSNIMLVTVRERYKRIGIRKALGTRPCNILVMIMVESLFITAVAGTTGPVIAVGFVTLGDYLVTACHIGEMSIMGETVHLFNTPVPSPQMVLGVLVMMIIAGIMAGYMSAHRTIRISTIGAMRD